VVIGPPDSILTKLGFKRVGDADWESDDGVKAKASIVDGKFAVEFM